MLNERTGTVVPANPVLLARGNRNKLKMISDEEAHRRINAANPGPRVADAPAFTPPANEPKSDRDLSDPKQAAFLDARAKVLAFTDKESLEVFARDSYSVELDRRSKLETMKNKLIGDIAETLGVDAED
jgi:hypothetical protein